jgi:Domain of unknown function (DUF4349)
MSSPENPPIDEKFDRLLSELRAARPEAPERLRQRVAAIAARPAAPPRRRLRVTWVLAPAAAALVAGAIAVGVISGGSEQRDPLGPLVFEGATKQTTDAAGAARSSVSPITPAKRAQLYTAEITLRVKDLSEATQAALRRTRALGGYVRSVDYGEGDGEGTARLVLRVPIGRVQTAIMRYSQLGTILDQHVSVRDVQPRLDRRFNRIAELRRLIQTLSGEELATAQAELEALQTAQRRERRQASFATASLNLTTKDAVVVPTEPGRIRRALDRAADVLAAETVAVVYAAVAAAPFILLGAVLVVAIRAARRRSDRRLLGY